MTENFAPTKSLCLLNENAQCNTIWMAQPAGLKLVHFLTLQAEMGRERLPVDSAYDRCERNCVPGSPVA
jgi:hypothetical protein